MAEKQFLIEQHSFVKELIFRLKSSILICLRFLKNAFTHRTQKFTRGVELKDQLVISFSETELWTNDDNEQNWILTAGKIQNLRIAARRLNGVEVPANKIFSFWEHIGRPSKIKGYVVGREIREGCLIPTIAGGLCQLSNGLYDAALKAGFEIIERHKHTRVIKGSLAEVDRDATVKWNYIDLRFKSQFPFRIETELTADKLILAFKSTSKDNPPEKNVFKINQAVKLNDCYSCGNFDCFKHPDPVARKNRQAITTFILDEKWSEYETYVKEIAKPTDHFIVPFSADSHVKINRFTWRPSNRNNCNTVLFTAFYRSLYLRTFATEKRNIFAMMLNLDRKVAGKMIKHIPIESTHIVIAQNLLPYAWEAGMLGGRTFDVLMTRLPLETLHDRLDLAFKKHSESPTLSDFRAPEALVKMETAALTKARHIITPHQEIAGLFNNKSVRSDWKRPTVKPKAINGSKILFPASALGRKGAYEVRQLAKELNLTVAITGDATEYDAFWNGVKIEKAKTNPFDEIQLVVYPAYVEHQPRFLLKAIAAGVPVITTTASGLCAEENVTILPIGDYEAFKRAVIEKLNAILASALKEIVA
jgi:hypothetical protein